MASLFFPLSSSSSFFFFFFWKELDLVLWRFDKKVLLKVILNSTITYFTKELDHVLWKIHKSYY